MCTSADVADIASKVRRMHTNVRTYDGIGKPNFMVISGRRPDKWVLVDRTERAPILTLLVYYRSALVYSTSLLLLLAKP